ncbi:methyl-accepting chemotaxis protein [Pseudomonas syringae]|nr:methyl-accepting chemotaxis protein [Pseudomonas syringae]MBS7420424.1 methyl-accepting chemotaxis protein [Pseudomonas syringae]MBS7431957.1 methyl-accepting chemotaxis protein [Pseudomonas syringae]MBS7472499.1 methyl-accepting chemotaxis protein [Pseudomonas syringae]QVI68266.1 methyl-accepting chemotaxis protein [Pseudomonas syringae]QVI82908.1 methyl-accepting chemotaxis protein [Pseudomonas syringae]
MLVLNRVLGNLSVGGKLLLGFGLVLLVTLGVALTAFRSLGVLQQRAEQSRQESSIQALILRARIDEKAFALDLAPQRQEQVRETIKKLNQLLDDLPTNSATHTTVRTAVSAYLEQFLDYADSLRRAREARLRMQARAQTAGDSFTLLFLDQLDALNTRLGQGTPPSSNQMVLLEQTAALRDKLAKLRDSELYYSLDGEERYRSDWEMSMSDLLAAMQALDLGEQQGESLREASTALGDYRKAFREFVDSRGQSAQSSAAMNAQTEQVSKLLAQADQQQRQAVLNDNRNADRQLGLITVLALALGIGASLLIRQLIVQPLRQAVQLVQRVAAGDLSDPPPDSGRRDELGQLLDTVGNMLGSLRGLVGRIDRGVSSLNGMAGSLAEVTLSNSRGVEHQRQETELAATAMQQMAATAQEVARNAGEASEAVAHADQQAREGDELVRQASDKIDHLAVEMMGCAEAMRSLLVESAAIGGVLDVIKTVAEQTNLLALNAAIEAARAGEQGRGFAVVADEVRGLARRTQRSTAEIEGLIVRLSAVAQHAAERLQGSHVLSDETVVLAAQASQALARITRAVSSIEQMNQQIAAAAEQQSVVAEQVSQSMTRVREVAEGSARESLQLQVSTADLQQVGGELKAAVGHFRT